MTQPTNAAKAAAVLAYTYGIDKLATAVALYNDLSGADDADEMNAVLDKYGTGVWGPLEHLNMGEWWGNLEMLALSIEESIEECREEPT